MSKLLITGAHGLLGAALTQVAQKKNHTVIGFEGNICNPRDIKPYQDSSIEWIIHAAALTNVDACEGNKPLAYYINIEGTKNMRELAKELNAHFIYISTASVFSGKEGNYTETDIPYPQNFYNLTKYVGEELSLEYEKTLVLRTNIIGVHPDGSRGRNFFEWLMDSIQENKDITLFKDVFVNPLSHWTISEFICDLISINPLEKILHLGSQNILSKADIGEYILKKYKDFNGHVTWAEVDQTDHAFRPKNMWLNCEEIQKKYHFQLPKLHEEIEKILFKMSSPGLTGGSIFNEVIDSRFRGNDKGVT